MFTGIVQRLGRVQAVRENDAGREFEISCGDLSMDIAEGDSVCCNGVCLSATSTAKDFFKCYAIRETLSKTNLGELIEGSPINLELSLLPTTRMGGHYVSGHVDIQVPVTDVENLSDDTLEFWVEIPQEYSKYCIPRGSVCFNGVSLTIADKKEDKIKVALIPITLLHTNLGGLEVGRKLNLEVDIMGKYIDSLLEPYAKERMAGGSSV